jgi:hypothetical protein
MLLLLLALAQDVTVKKDVSIKDVAVGDRVEVRFHSGNTISGTVVAPPGKTKDEAVNLATQSSITLDVSMEYPGLNGTMTVLKKEIQKITLLHQLDDKTRKSIEQMKKELAQGNATKPPPKAETPSPVPPVAEPPKADPKPEEAKPEDDQKAKDLFAKFPPPAWGPDRLNAIRVKRQRGVVPSLDEQEFEKNFALWDKARQAAAGATNSQKN